MSQPTQLPNVEPVLGAAVNATAVPLAKFALQVDAQPRPGGELVTVPKPAPVKSTVSVRFEPPELPVKQTTFAVINPVTMASDDDRFPALLFVFTVAETRAFPQARPVGVSNPVGSTVTMSGVFEAQVTWAAMSLVTGG